MAWMLMTLKIFKKKNDKYLFLINKNTFFFNILFQHSI
jgi:hypothetical protein